MHELSIAINIVEIVELEARERGAQVNAVHLKLGRLSGVVKDALLFSYDIACQGTPIEGSSLIVEEVPTLVYCEVCRSERTPASEYRLFCPVCDSPTPRILRGKELEVVALEIQ